jgi:hypothetical protein
LGARLVEPRIVRNVYVLAAKIKENNFDMSLGTYQYRVTFGFGAAGAVSASVMVDLKEELACES